MRFNISLNITKTRFYVLFVTLLVLIGVVGVIAFGTNEPEEFGHSLGELAGQGVLDGPFNMKGANQIESRIRVRNVNANPDDNNAEVWEWQMLNNGAFRLNKYIGGSEHASGAIYFDNDGKVGISTANLGAGAGDRLTVEGNTIVRGRLKVDNGIEFGNGLVQTSPASFSSCTTVRSELIPNNAVVTCPPNTGVVGGGGTCGPFVNNNLLQHSCPGINGDCDALTSGLGNSWKTACGLGTNGLARAWAICCPI